MQPRPHSSEYMSDLSRPSPLGCEYMSDRFRAIKGTGALASAADAKKRALMYSHQECRLHEWAHHN